MYTGRPCDCRHDATTLGFAPAAIPAVLQGTAAVVSWFNGHSSLYQATVAAIPQYGNAALQGDLCAYIVLRAWSGDQDFCRYAIDNCHSYYLGTQVGQAGPCGAADNSTKAAAREQWQHVDANRPDVAAHALALVKGLPIPDDAGNVGPIVYPGQSTGPAGGVGGLTGTQVLIGLAGIGLVAMLLTPRRSEG